MIVLVALSNSRRSKALLSEIEQKKKVQNMKLQAVQNNLKQISKYEKSKRKNLEKSLREKEILAKERVGIINEYREKRYSTLLTKFRNMLKKMIDNNIHNHS